MFAPARHFALSSFRPASAGRSRTAAWLEAWRAARVAEEKLIALAETNAPRRERGRRVFEACHAASSTLAQR
jgi:hypothetical protein